MFPTNRQSLAAISLGLSLFSLPAQAAPLQLNPQSSITTQPAPSIAQQNRKRKRFVPPKLKLDRGIPTQGRSDNASRGCQAQQDGPGLTLLVPEYVETSTSRQGKEIESHYAIGLTATAQPSFWAYVPIDAQAEEITLEFVLRNVEGKKLHSEMLDVPTQSGFLEIIPEGMPPLEAGVDYNWFLKQKSRCGELASLARETGEAWVRYVEPSTVSEKDGETGYWYDALSEAAGDTRAFGALVKEIGLEELL